MADEDRVEGSAKKLKGDVKETAGKVLGDSKLEAEGKGDKVAGKVQNAIGGENVGTTVQGRERYPVNVRYMRDFRSDVTSVGRVLVAGPQWREVDTY